VLPKLITKKYTFTKNKKSKMIFECIKADIFISDAEFDLIFPKKLREISAIHFTPIAVAKQAATYLATTEGVKILDIGSGAGKFCMVASAYSEQGCFVGVEQRKTLCDLAKRIAKNNNLQNVKFINKNITDVSFRDYDAFYFFNAFYENVSLLGKIDHKIESNRALYDAYNAYVCEQLDTMPLGTRLVTYYSFMKEIPDSYEIQETAFDGKLKLWEKIN
jgi:16S rRNA G527 N7-methylase RsmG